MNVLEMLQVMDAELDMAERDEKIDALITAVGKLGIIVLELKARVNFLEGQLVDTPDKARQAEAERDLDTYLHGGHSYTGGA